IDIGTNCEIVLGSRDWLLATAAPAGPAFEGAAIRCGMRAADGAIEGVVLDPGTAPARATGSAAAGNGAAQIPASTNGSNGRAAGSQRAATPAGASDSGGGVSLKVIGDCDPVGLCGSGLVDAVASLVAVGLLDRSGRFVPDDVAARIAPGLAGRLVMLGEERV